MPASALSLYRRHFGAIVLTCAVALLPANLLATGAVVFGLASLGAGGIAEARTHSEEISEKQQDLRDKPPRTEEARGERARQLGREAFEGGPTTDVWHLVRGLIPIAYATAITALLLLAGLFLAHGALVPLVARRMEGRTAGPAHAWAVAGSRIGPLVATGLLGAVIAAIGALFLIVPGLVLATGFALVPPVVILEGVSGGPALERSWRLLSGHWGEAFGWWALIVLFSVLASGAAALAPPGPWRPVVSAAVRLLLYPLPLVGLVLLYQKCVSTSGGSPPPDSSARGFRGTELR